jgi:signal transduction histidine kinase
VWGDTLRISQHLKLTLVLLIGAAFAVGLVGLWVRDQIHLKAYANLEREMEVLLHLEDVEAGILAAQNSEKSFLLRYPVDGILVAQAYVSGALSAISKTRNALESVADLNRRAGVAPEHRYREELESRLALFEVRLKRVVLLVKRKGDASSGLVWEMRRMVEGLERYLVRLEAGTEGAPPDPARVRAIQRLKADLLFIRRWEKDYFLRDDLVFISSVRARVAAIQEGIADGPFPTKERDRILTYLKTYLIYFERIALNDVQVLDERNRLNETAEDLQRLLANYVNSERGALSRAEDRIRGWQEKSLVGVMGLFGVILLVSVVLAFRLTRRITGSLDTLVRATKELGEKGECPTIEMENDDEFARLADAFNGMVARLKETQLQLVQSEKLTATGKLSASIAHEINNPLFGIQGCLERILKRLPPDDRDRRLVELAVRESQRIARLVEGLRDYHRPSDQTMSPVDLLEILEDIFLINRKYIQQHKVKLVRRLPKTLPKVAGTRDQLQMVFVNLITNAVEAMSGGGELTVTAVQDKGTIILSFVDTGRGIDPKALPKIFEPFFSTKPEVKGVGLGLSISYGIIRRHGGEIRVKSQPGETVFSVVLPVLRQAEEEAA